VAPPARYRDPHVAAGARPPPAVPIVCDAIRQCAAELSIANRVDLA
jgi:hypothetical protein